MIAASLAVVVVLFARAYRAVAATVVAVDVYEDEEADDDIAKLLMGSVRRPRFVVVGAAVGLLNGMTTDAFRHLVKSSMFDMLLDKDMGDRLCMGDGEALAERFGVTTTLGRYIVVIAAIGIAADVVVVVVIVDDFAAVGGAAEGNVGKMPNCRPGAAAAATVDTVDGKGLGLFLTNLLSRSVSGSPEWLCDDVVRDRLMTRLLTMNSPGRLLTTPPPLRADLSFSCETLIFGMLECPLLFRLLHSSFDRSFK